MGGPWKHREPVMLYAEPTALDLCARIEVMTLLAAGAGVAACQELVERYTAPRVAEAEALYALAHARAGDDERHDAEERRRYRAAGDAVHALIEIRQWILQPVVEHLTLYAAPVFIPLSEWERRQEKAKG